MLMFRCLSEARRVVPALASFALVCSLAWGQSNVGEISGQVSDATGAAVPGCAVTATHAQTGLKRSVVTQENGMFVFAALPEGTYNVRAEKEGFRPTEQTGVVLDAATRRSIDFRMEVGAVAESVSVSAAVEQVQTASGDVTRVISSRQLSQVALNGRNYSQLLRLIPGAVATTLDPFGLALSTTGQRINGIRTDSIVFNVDGAENMDNGGNSNAAVNPSADAIAEVKILTSGYSAEFGGRSGALINVVTQERHAAVPRHVVRVRSQRCLRRAHVLCAPGGSAALQRLRLYAGRSGVHSQEVEYGRSRSSSSSSARSGSTATSGSTRVNIVPTAAERSGDFRGSTLAAPVDPLNGQPFPDRTIPRRASPRRPAAAEAAPAAEFRRTRRELRRHRRQPDRSARSAGALRLQALSEDADQLPLGARRVGHPRRISGRQSRHRARRPPASGICDCDRYVAYLLRRRR